MFEALGVMVDSSALLFDLMVETGILIWACIELGLLILGVILLDFFTFGMWRQ